MPAEAPPAPTALPPPTTSAAVDNGPGSEIHVTQATVDSGPKQVPPKKGGAMDRLFKDLRAKAKPNFYESAPEPSTPPEQGGSTEAVSTPPTEQPTPDKSTQPAKAGVGETPTPAPATQEGKKERANPWKLVDEYKAKASKAETELAEVRKSGIDPAAKKAYDEQVAQLRTQNEELEKEIRFVNYAKSAEFKSKYQEPYEKAWHRAAQEISEIQVTDPATNEVRPATVNDLAEIVNLPLGKARDVADQVFGKFADDIMAYRKEIQQLFQAQESALKDAKESATRRDKERSEQQQHFQTKTADEIKAAWEKANAEFIEKPELADVFKPAEGDEEGRTRLTKGYELVDKAFSVNSADPALSPEDRAKAVRMHAAVRMRAAGFGVVKHRLDKATKRITELEKELSQYKETSPPTGGTSGPSTTPVQTGKAWDSIRSGLQKIARPA